MAQAEYTRANQIIPDQVPCVGFTRVDDPNIQKKIRKLRDKHHSRCKQSQDSSSKHQKYVYWNDAGDFISTHRPQPNEFCVECSVLEISIDKCSSEMCIALYEQLVEDLNVWTEAEIQNIIGDTLKDFEPAEIQYREQKCLTCGEETDERLMPDKCHTVSRKSHGEIRRVHTKQGNKFHLGQQPPYHVKEGVPCFSGTKFVCCGKTERSFWKDILDIWKDILDILDILDIWKDILEGLAGYLLLKDSGCKTVWSCCGQQKESKGCSQVKQYDCCQSKAKTHKCAPERRHIPATEFPNPSWGFNPLNWSFLWPVIYRHKCGHQMGEPGCRDYFPCCKRFEDEDEGGCDLEDSQGCEDECAWYVQ
jgi:hypothetical protein